MDYDQYQIESFVNGYVQAMLFATNDEHNEPLDANYSGGDIDTDCFEDIRTDCLNFIEQAGDTLESGDLEQHGMDFFYTRNGHGVGFFDRGLTSIDAEFLNGLASNYPEIYPFAENGTVYLDFRTCKKRITP